MSKLEVQISDYFNALHPESDSSEPGMPVYPVGEPHRPGRSRASRRRRTALVVAAIVVMAALVTVGLVRSTEDSSPYVGTPTDRPAPPPVPHGWKPVMVGSVRFSVPEAWPVVTDATCDEIAGGRVFLGPVSTDCAGDLPIPYVMADQLDLDPDGEIAQMSTDDTLAPSAPTATLELLNGLRAIVYSPDIGCYGCLGMYQVSLIDDDVFIDLAFAAEFDGATALEIIETIGAAPESPPDTTVPAPTTTAVPVPPVPTSEAPPDPGAVTTGPPTEGDLNALCAAIEDFRQSGQIQSDGTYGPDTASYLQRMVDAAPAEFRPPLETMLAWIEQGSPLPKPPEVSQAELKSTQDWAAKCSGSSAK